MATHVLQLLKMVQLKYGVTMICKFFFWSFHMIYIVYLLSVISDFPKTVGLSVLTDRNAVGPTISQYISDRMSGKTDIWKDRRFKFIPSQFPLPMALNSVFSFIKMSDRDLKFVYLLSDRHVPLCNRNSYTNVRKCKHPFSRNQHLQNVEH